MVRCGRCCLHKSMRVANLLVNLCGVAMIIYSLWLLKKWKLGVSNLPTLSYLPKPWFIYACLGVGIAVCLSTLFGHIATNSTNDSILFLYIFSICCLLLLQVAVVVTIFFRINWELQLSKYIDEHHTEFKSFLIFHLMMCRIIVIMALVPQINVIVLAIIIWSIGTEPRWSDHPSHFNIPDFGQSFLVAPAPNSPMHETIISNSRQSFRHTLLTPSQYSFPRQSFLRPYIFGIFRVRFPARPRTIYSFSTG